MIAKSPQPLLAARLRRRGPLRRGPQRGGPVRRGVLRALFTAAVASFTGGALARVATTPHDGPGGPPTGGSGPGRAPAPGAGRPVHGAFDETYRGRRIQGRPVTAAVPEFEVLVDGRPLHLMRCAGGGYLTLVNHYETYPTPLAATRAAVDELGGARLARSVGHGAALRREGGGHGAHA
ncbi:tyrosinase cofactor [Streptomyces changanensis]|uniref:Tyrosinase cofactor n=1 Tax=Streptomyces changanensis TaxID=2964669 RepID=A0ABY5N6U8_9ACTN|nr:tyrosinase cofactor [Streptomyces changanensis]UUS32252.1 tyrosinase cofactor [Streptomyces changanensis]